MHQTLIKRIGICFVGILLLVTCASCEARPSYLVKDYLNELSVVSGIGNSDDIDDNIVSLYEWKILNDEDLDKLDDLLDYDFLSKTILRLLDENDNDFDVLVYMGLIDNKTKKDKLVTEEIAKEIIKKAVDYINNKEFDSIYDFKFKDNIKTEDDELLENDIIYRDNNYYIVSDIEDDNYDLKEADLEDVYDYFEIADTYEIDFEDAIVTPYGQAEDSVYINDNYNLLSSKNHVFNSEGFRISYTLNKAGIDIHISKEQEGLNIYGDLSVNSVKPSFKWTYEENDLKNCYFKISMNTTEKIGVSTGKYANYHVKFKNLDKSSFQSTLKSMIEPAKDQLEATIPICEVKTPIPNIPTAFLNFDILIKLYVSGKTEIVLYNSNLMGFETKEGKVRFINEHSNDLDYIIQASSKAALGLNLSLEAATFRLCDVELDGGVRAEVKSTLHLYDDEGNLESKASDVSYGALQDVTKTNNNVFVCGDLSLHWLMDLVINTSKTKANKLGFSRTFSILNDNDQIFGNLHHIENGQFVKKCTRKKKTSLTVMTPVNSDKIVLESLSKVIKQNESYQIVINALPSGYTENDLLYTSEDESIATVSNGLIKGIKPGSVKIRVFSKDDKYDAYVNILVSTG